MRVHAVLKFVIVFLLFSYLFLPLNKAFAFTDSWQKGLTIRLTNQSNSDIDKVLQDAKNLGANYITITPGFITSSRTSSNVDSKSSTPSDEKLIYAINKSHQLGLKVMIKPHLDINGTSWRASLDPDNKVEFFKNYKNMIMHYAVLCDNNNVEQFSVGAELVKLTTNLENEKYWRDIISSVRNVYSGSLTYSANADYGKYNELGLPFWDALDVIGVSMYRSMSYERPPSYSDINNSWHVYEKDLFAPLNAKYNKPIIFTEIGYRSVDFAAERPWDYSNGGQVSLETQRILFEGLFSYWNNSSYLHGMHIWDFELGSSVGGSSDKGYTPQNKPASQVIKNYFGKNVESTNGEGNEVIIVGGLISNLNYTSFKKYQESVFTMGAEFYTDRDYTVNTLPSYLENKLLIKVPNDDKILTNSNAINFNAEEDIKVYIAYDYRSNNIPLWLQSFSKLNQTITTTDTTFNIYEKTFKQGQKATLGGNLQSPANGALSNYFVVVVEDNINSANVNPTPTPTPVPTISISPTPTPIVSLAPSPTPLPSVLPTPALSPTPTALPKLGFSDIVIVEPYSNQQLSGEKKIKVYVKNLELSQYNATYQFDTNPEVFMVNSKDGVYKQVKYQFDNLTWNGFGPYKITIRIYDLNNNYLGQNFVNVYSR